MIEIYCRNLLPKYTAEINSKELTLNKPNTKSNNCSFLDVDISILHEKLCTKTYNKTVYFFPLLLLFLDDDSPFVPSFGVYLSQHVLNYRVCSGFFYFKERNLSITMYNWYVIKSRNSLPTFFLKPLPNSSI